MNQVFLTGRLVSDPVSRKIGEGDLKVANFSIAVDNKVGPKKEKSVSFVDVCAFGTTANIILENFAKGAMLAIAGHLKQDSYTDRNGNEVKKMQVIGNEVLNIPSKRTAAPQQTAQSAAAYTKEQYESVPF